MTNPLLNSSGLPAFSKIRPEHVEPAIDELLARGRTETARLLEQEQPFSWENLVAPLEDLDEELDRAWSPVSHMNSVVNSDELREAYNACLPKLSDYATEMGQNEDLYRAFQSIADGPDYSRLDAAQRKSIDNALRDFRLSGIGLDANGKERYREIMLQLSSLTSKFEENILDATNAWHKQVTDESDLSGLPDSALALAKQTAEQKDMDGWVLTLDFPSYYPVLTYADNRNLREEVYTAYVTRASDEGPHAGKWDNTPVMREILALRQEVASLLGYENYAERSIATKMASSTEQVLSFLNELAERSLPAAREDLDALEKFASEHYNVNELEAWDIAYYSEKLRQQRYDISQEELKPWFPVTRVIPGMFAVVERMYGLQIREIDGVDSWHEDVSFYEIHDADGKLRGQFYLDLYARPHKRGGAWMDECIGRRADERGIQIPVAYLTCNFTPPVDGKPSLLTHNEVETLFHEFGHGLHHMLTLVDYPAVSGISGVAWDAVELPSQFMENWCWEREALDMFAVHVDSGEPLPEEMFKRMLAAKNFQSAMQMVRQLEFSIFDFRLHMEYEAGKTDVYDLLNDVRSQVAVIRPPSFNRFPHSFSHIFAGGYAAGYYSYKWAEVLSADAFSAFEETHIFDADTGRRFMETILEQGGSREPMELFVEFRGREPTIDALLRHSGF